MFCYYALFRTLLSGLSLELDYLEAIGWGRGEAVCKLFFSVKCGCLKQQAVIMISKGPHLRDQPAEWRTSLTNELLNISPSLSCLLLLLLYLFIFVLVFPSPPILRYVFFLFDQLCPAFVFSISKWLCPSMFLSHCFCKLFCVSFCPFFLTLCLMHVFQVHRNSVG